MTLLEKYIGYHNGFIERLESFTELTRNKILKKLKNETDRSNFLSTVSEIHFGELFNRLHIENEYDKKFPNGKTPDWLLKIDTTHFVICDVYRLGRSKIDQIRSDFENLLIERIEKIIANYCVKITFVEEYFDEGFYDTDIVMSELEEWILLSKREVGDKILICDNFEFEILISNSKVNHVTIVGNASSIDIKPNKLK